MKVVILAGGRGARLSEETTRIPKPMVHINGKPILVHIMDIYKHFGHIEFIICAGYKGELIKSYFNDYFLHNSDVTFFLNSGTSLTHNTRCDQISVTVVDTGLDTPTAGRVQQIQKYVGDERFMLTYGDAVSNVNITNLLEFHSSEPSIATLTAVKVPGRFGSLKLAGNFVEDFEEKIPSTVNGGFFVFEPQIFEYLGDGSEMLEKNILPQLARNGQLKAYQHQGYFQPMDSLHDKFALEDDAQNTPLPWMNFNV